MFGRLPNKKDLLQNKLKVSIRNITSLTMITGTHHMVLHQERKYFDSGDYALSKAGKASDAGVTQIGSQHPNPENIPHLTSPGNGNGVGNGHAGPGHAMQSGSPVKESSYLHRETSINDQEDGVDGDAANSTNNARTEAEKPEASVSPPPIREGVPIRQ